MGKRVLFIVAALTVFGFQNCGGSSSVKDDTVGKTGADVVPVTLDYSITGGLLPVEAPFMRRVTVSIDHAHRRFTFSTYVQYRDQHAPSMLCADQVKTEADYERLKANYNKMRVALQTEAIVDSGTRLLRVTDSSGLTAEFVMHFSDTGFNTYVLFDGEDLTMQLMELWNQNCAIPSI